MLQLPQLQYHAYVCTSMYLYGHNSIPGRENLIAIGCLHGGDPSEAMNYYILAFILALGEDTYRGSHLKHSQDTNY